MTLILRNRWIPSKKNKLVCYRCMFLCVETFIDKKGRNRLLDQTSLAGHLAQGHDSLNRWTCKKGWNGHYNSDCFGEFRLIEPVATICTGWSFSKITRTSFRFSNAVIFNSKSHVCSWNCMTSCESGRAPGIVKILLSIGWFIVFQRFPTRSFGKASLT